MSYTELLDRFWGSDRNFSHYEIILFHYLLYRCSSLGWPDTFSVSNEELMQTLKLRPTIMREARKGLVDAGLINFQSGTGRGCTSFFSFMPLEKKKGVRLGTPFEEKGVRMGTPFDKKRGTNGNTFLEESSSKSSNNKKNDTEKGVRLGTPFCNSKEKQNKEEKNSPPAPPIKKKKEKEKEITQSKLCSTQDKRRVRTRVSDNGQEEIVFKDVEKEVKEKLNRRPEPPLPNLPGSLEEVIAFFEKNAADKLPDLREEAEAFFYHYESYGWNGTSNRKIVDWESKANLWICDKAIKHKQTKNNHATTTNNNTSDDRAASDREAAELVDRLLRENRIEDEGVPRYVQP